jgi:cellulose synthase/poly-beta-1,6-N-acetylglucosamine synthase-like glycosyltransferase
MITALAIGAVTLVAAGVFFIALYLFALTLAALLGRAPRVADGPAQRRFAILIPAHNEVELIGRLLRNLSELDYSAEQYDVCVVADNCDDLTALTAISLGADVYERIDHLRQGKGYALRWLLHQLRDKGREYDAFIVLDADSIVSRNFLRRMDARLESGSQVIQAYYQVLNAEDSRLTGLRYAALAALHYLRPVGRAALHLSCGLKGNGMCFSAALLEQFGWRWFTLAEDVEFHLALVTEGVRVDFEKDATVLADMPVSFAQANTQNQRWEQGRIAMIRQWLPALILRGVKQASPLRLDAAIEQLIPPLSVPFAVAAACGLLAVGLGAHLALVLAVLALAGQIVYLLAGLMLVHAPLQAYLALSAAPSYIAWKLALYGQALLTRQTTRWVRTARAASS